MHGLFINMINTSGQDLRGANSGVSKRQNSKEFYGHILEILESLPVIEKIELEL